MLIKLLTALIVMVWIQSESEIANHNLSTQRKGTLVSQREGRDTVYLKTSSQY